MEEIKQSIRKVQIVGTLSEMNLEFSEEAEMKVNDKKVTCKGFIKPDFKNPTMTIDVNGNPIGVDMFNVYELNRDGKKKTDKEMSSYKARKTMLDTYVTKAMATEDKPATRVKIDGFVNMNEYAKEDGSWVSFMQPTAFQVTSSNVPEEDMAEAEFTGAIKSMAHEVNKEEEETGRLIVMFNCFGRNGEIVPYKFVVENDLADDFEESYEVNDCCKIYTEIISKTVGATKKKGTRAFGRRETKIVDGFNVTEYSVFTGDEPFEEENEYFVSAEDISKREKERDIMINSEIDKKKKKSSTKKTTKKLGNRKSKMQATEEMDEDDCPF